MTDYAERIAAAAGDPAALLKLAIELAAAHASVEGRLAELQRADADRKRGAADRQARRRRGEIAPARDVTQDHATSRDITLHHDASRDVTGNPPGSSSPTPPITPTPTHTHTHAGAWEARTEAGHAARVHCERQMGERVEVIERYLAAIGARDVDGWWKELARIIGPATGVGGVDLAQALEDALLSQPIPNRPGPLRTFVTSAMQERKRAAAERDGIDTRPARSSAARRPSPDETAASRAFAQIMLLVQTGGQVGQGTSKFIPRGSVEALGARVLAAYDECGGASRFLTDDGAKIGLARRDFTQAFIGWTETNPQEERMQA